MSNDGNYDKVETLDGGTVIYTLDGYLHRLNGPAVIFPDGYKAWYVNGEQHSINDKPAVIRPDGELAWYVNGELRRDNGKPAVITSGGVLKWYEDSRLIDIYYPDFGCMATKIKTREQALERLNANHRPYSYDLYMADIDRRFPQEKD